MLSMSEKQHFLGVSLIDPTSGHSRTFSELFTRRPEALVGYDIAEMNLLCATGLPGAENLNIPECLATLDRWASRVRMETNGERHRFRPNPRCPTDARYRCFMLIKTLRDGYDLKHYLLPKKGTGTYGCVANGVDGKPARFDDCKLLFIHGLVGKERIGSCSSLPVLYVAVGRRLGYPIRLVLSVQHMFIRWEDEHEVFNMEGSGPDFISSNPDESYIDMPRPWTTEEKTCGAFLRSITPAEELAAFLFMRRACLGANQRWAEARDVMRQACRLHAAQPHYMDDLDRVERVIASETRYVKPKLQYLMPVGQLEGLASSEKTPCS